MSNPVSHVEIEDVLSSIRKLVADERRAVQPATKPASDKLVLTPAQRVRDPQQSEQPAGGARMDPVVLTDPVDLGPAFDQNAEDRSMDEIPRNALLSEYGDVENEFPDIGSFEPVDADASEHDGQPFEEEADSEEHPVPPISRLIEEEVSAALGFVRQSISEGLTRPEANDEFPADAEDWHEEDEGYSDLLAAETANVSEGLTDEVDGAGQDWAREQASERTEADHAWSEPVRSPPMTLEDKVAALSRLVARGSNDFEEERDRAQDDEIAAVVEPMSWPEAAPFDEMVEPEPETGSNVLRTEGVWPVPREENEAPAADEEETTDAELAVADGAADQHALPIDQDALRALVIDIVRSELQGEMGERITRNVRKLVRREIHRMLISQEME